MLYICFVRDKIIVIKNYIQSVAAALRVKVAEVELNLVTDRRGQQDPATFRRTVIEGKVGR